MTEHDLALLGLLALVLVIACGALAVLVGDRWSMYLNRPPVCTVDRVEMERRTDWVALAADVVGHLAGDLAGDLAGEVVEHMAGEAAGTLVDEAVEGAVAQAVADHVRIRDREIWGCPVCDARFVRRKPDDSWPACLACLGCLGLVGGILALVVALVGLVGLL